ncbi:hypothetical protein FRACYDRAFT_212404 [Fragilariopsis cylindrus CCMP1102]|uniref:Uncharacterized protein n=1 Tax=Fragilariopsis cylindrus CCMP1102 TaxID=635003 RepID=A0A1E7ETW7_9STRA|nr:hypothetical protein FRACYDRAFT_212404 [Fragilariopsis cylindrus CCMP1102]|eukprot:OEU09306.1 hypothetical protein FRACYDRAFT_212404 [Fragilariopsis cylindrus CCMP1102]
METLFLKSLLILLLVATVAIGSTAFVIPKTVYSSVSVSGRNNNNAAAAIVVCKLLSSSDNSNDGSSSGGSSGSSGDAWVLRNKDRTDIRNFLTQRSIQSFVYLLNQCREEHTVRWLEKTLDFTSIERFHGTGAFNQTKFPEWDSVFLDYMDRPDEVIVIQMRQQRRQRKLSGYNSYIEIEYELHVNPSALVRRILSVREQLSNEWVEDLDMLMKLNDEILDTFEDYTKEATKKDLQEEDDDDDDDDDDDVDTGMKIKSEEEKKRHDTIFDRNVLFSWSQSLWSPNRSSSPYRKANFDLLLLLATQESIHRVLKSYKDDDEVRQETYEFLLDFYKDHVKNHFDGHQTYARSEDFLDEMVTSSRTLIETKNEILAWVNPARVAEDIVRERSEVALEWMRISETISDEHTDLRRLLFTNMVSKSLPDETLTDVIHNAVKETVEEETEQEEEGSTSSTTAFGAFE